MHLSETSGQEKDCSPLLAVEIKKGDYFAKIESIGLGKTGYSGLGVRNVQEAGCFLVWWTKSGSGSPGLEMHDRLKFGG